MLTSRTWDGFPYFKDILKLISIVETKDMKALDFIAILLNLPIIEKMQNILDKFRELEK